MPTGSGKTFMFTSLAKDIDRPTLILVNRDELVRQTVKTVQTVWPGASIGIVKSKLDEWNDGQQVVIGSVQTMQKKRLTRIPRDRFKFIVYDEFHGAASPTGRAILNHFQYGYLLGCSATPFRHDGQGLDDNFGDRLVYTYALRSAINDGVLCVLTQYSIETSVDLSGVSVSCGDYAVGELSNAINTLPRNNIILDAHDQRCQDRRTILFAADVAHATTLCDMFISKGVSAAIVTGKTHIDERRQILKDFQNGKIQVVCNCAVLLEGFDCPAIGAVLMARPTKSRGLYIQAVGRGLRKFPGKKDCLILDFSDNCHRHKMISVVDLFGDPKTKDCDGQNVIDFVDGQVELQQKELKIQTMLPLNWRFERVCPWGSVPDLRGYVPFAGWHNDPASDPQIKFLHGAGLDVVRTLTKGQCSYLLDRVLELRAKNPDPPSPKQRYFLQSRKQWRDDLTFNDAKKLIGQLKGVA